MACRIFALFMKLIGTWLMVICTLAGLSGRIFAVNHASAASCVKSSETCCQDLHDSSLPENHHHDDGSDCPPEHHHHHHHGCCSQPMPPLALDDDFICRLGTAESSLLGVRHEGEVPPEGPFLGLEKPPLI
jgi:hypothetical protein